LPDDEAGSSLSATTSITLNARYAFHAKQELE